MATDGTTDKPGTKYPDLFSFLSAPFDAGEVKVRTLTNAGNRQLHYVTARTVMNRLDRVLGPENWWDEYLPGENSVLCRLSIRLPDGTTLTKSDAGGYAGMADSGDDDKSGFSDAFKRAAVKFGVSRYLYKDGVPDYSEVPNSPDSSNGSKHLPAQQAPRLPQTNGNGQHHNAPRTGRALFAWCKDRESEFGVGLVTYINGWAKTQGTDARMVDWTDAFVSVAHEECVAKLASMASNGSKPQPATNGEASDELAVLRQRIWNEATAIIRTAKKIDHPDMNMVVAEINKTLDGLGQPAISSLKACTNLALLKALAAKLGEVLEFVESDRGGDSGIPF